MLSYTLDFLAVMSSHCAPAQLNLFYLFNPNDTYAIKDSFLFYWPADRRGMSVQVMIVFCLFVCLFVCLLCFVLHFLLLFFKNIFYFSLGSYTLLNSCRPQIQAVSETNASNSTQLWLVHTYINSIHKFYDTHGENGC